MSRSVEGRRLKRPQSLDTNRASATLLLPKECQLGSGSHAHTESVTDIVFVRGSPLDWLLKVVWPSILFQVSQL